MFSLSHTGPRGCPPTARAPFLSRVTPTAPSSSPPPPQPSPRTRASSSPSPSPSPTSLPLPTDVIHEELIAWLKLKGMPPQKVSLCDKTGQAVRGLPMGVTIASEDVARGDTLLSMPVDLCITLDRIFADKDLAELLTTSKLSELAVLTLHLMYEKKQMEESDIRPLIRELDRQRARGQQAVPSPLLWDEDEVASLLQGSPVVAEVKQRLDSLRKEYEELDTVWYMAGALFDKYPFDPPTECFSFEVFQQAFCAVQASIVHLRGPGVSPCQRFAIVPMGPPMVQYESQSKASFFYNPETHAVELVSDREYRAGDVIKAWCGPQPNSKLILNYGIVDEGNPFDALTATVTLANTDPLYVIKRTALAKCDLGTKQAFKFIKDAALPEKLVPYLRLCHAETEAEVTAAAHGLDLSSSSTTPTSTSTPSTSSEFPGWVSARNEARVVEVLTSHLRARLSLYPSDIESDRVMETDPRATPKQRVSAKLVRIEKEILIDAMNQVMSLPGAKGGVETGKGKGHVTVSAPGVSAEVCG